MGLLDIANTQISIDFFAFRKHKIISFVLTLEQFGDEQLKLNEFRQLQLVDLITGL